MTISLAKRQYWISPAAPFRIKPIGGVRMDEISKSGKVIETHDH
jgi:hypothetical protein